MLSEEQINSNKERFLNIVTEQITREGVNRDILIRQLCESDFFVAPSSTKYHGAYAGGLCEHCLGVYDKCMKIKEAFGWDISNESIAIVALFHDFSKMNIYKKDIRNEKVYSPVGSKHDALGNFDWVSRECYSHKTAEDGKFVFGNHEETAAFMTNTFIPLRVDEWAAILHHMGQLSSDSAKDNLGEVYKSYKLALLLHLADMVDAFD